MDASLLSVQDQYLEKKRKTRKITFSIILALVVAVAIIFITLGCVNVDIRPQFVTKADQVTIYREGNSNINIDKQSQIYQQFDELYKNMFNVPYLTAAFSGATGGYTIDEGKIISNWYTNANETTVSSDVTNVLGTNYVKLHFNQLKTLVKADGSEYISIFNRNKLTYQDVYFAINEEDIVKDFTFLFATKGNNDERTTITKITLKANTSSLFEEFVK